MSNKVDQKVLKGLTRVKPMSGVRRTKKFNQPDVEARRAIGRPYMDSWNDSKSVHSDVTGAERCNGEKHG